METQSRLMFMLAAVLLALVALIVLVDAPDDAAEIEEGERSWTALLPDVEAQDVVRIELQLDGEQRVFLREEDGWRIVAPVRAEARQDAVEALVDSFARVEVDEQALPGSLDEYGLDTPRARVRLELADGSEHVVQVGRDAPVGWHSYVRLGSDGPARTTRTRLAAGLEGSLADYRAAGVWSLPWESVDRVELRGPDAVVELQRIAATADASSSDGDNAAAADTPDSGWLVRAALAGPGDAAPPSLEGEPRRAAMPLVERSLGTLRSMQAQRFLDGRDPSAVELPWRIRVEAAGASQELALARGDDGWIVRSPIQTALVEIPDGWQDAWLRPVPEWWEVDPAPAWAGGDAQDPADTSDGSQAAPTP